MITVAFRKVPPDKKEKLRWWMAEVQRREEEVKETFRQETVQHEQAYLIDNEGDAILVYVMEVEDPDAARDAFQTSQLAIDHEHRQIMDEVAAETLHPELLYDVRLS